MLMLFNLGMGSMVRMLNYELHLNWLLLQEQEQNVNFFDPKIST